MVKKVAALFCAVAVCVFALTACGNFAYYDSKQILDDEDSYTYKNV